MKRTDDGSLFYRELLDDLRTHWRQGVLKRVEEYLETHPRLSEHPEALQELILCEFQLRVERGERPEADEYIAKFPHLRQSLPERIAAAGLGPACDGAAERSAAERTDHPTVVDGSTNPKHLSNHIRARTLHVRCPHCNHRVEAVADQSMDNIACGSCGSIFNLVSVTSETRLAQTRQSIGHFDLIEQIGIGAFGTVWKARDNELDRTVAIKIPRKGQLSPAEAEQFFREARAAAQLRHPGIVTVHEVGRTEDSIYIVSDFVRGVTLADWLTAQRCTSREAAALCMKVARSLQHAHEVGVIHRDLKPGNIMIDDYGEPHLMDFGLAKRDAGEVTLTLEGGVMGTPAFMSPEQARGEGHEADRRTDIYSTGVILYQLLTGELPFRGNAHMMVHQVINREAPSPRNFNHTIPRDLETICLKCLEKDRDKRFATAEEFADELQRFLDGTPIHSRPISRLERGWRWCKRNPVTTGFIGAWLAVLLGALGLAVGIAWQQRQIARERSEYARKQRLLAEERQILADDQKSLAEKEKQDNEATTLKLQQSVLGEATALRVARAPGYRAKVWDKLREAKNLKDSPEIAPTIQTEVLATLGDEIGLDPEARTADIARSSTAFPADFPKDLAGNGPQAHVTLDDGDIVAAIAPLSNTVVTLWRRETSATDYQVLDVQTPSGLGIVHDLVFSPDGGLLAAGCEEGSIIWSVPSMTLRSLFRGPTINSVAIDPTGTLVSTLSYGKEIETWSVTSNRRVSLLKTDERTTRLEYSRDGGHLLAIGPNDELLRAWSVRDTPEKRTFVGHLGAITAATVSPDGKHLGTVSKDRTLRIWNLHTGETLHVCEGHEREIEDLDFSPDGRFVASGDYAGVVRLWDVATGKELAVGIDDAIPGGTDRRRLVQVWGLRFSRDGDAIAVTGSDATVVWRLVQANGEPRLERAARLNLTGGYDVAIRPGGGEVLVLDRTGLVTRFTQEDPPVATQLTMSAHISNPVLHFDATGEHFTTFSDYGVINVVDWNSPNDKRTVNLGVETDRIAVTSDFHYVAAPHGNGISVWDLRHEKEVFNLPGEDADIWDARWSADGAYLALAISDGRAVVWNLHEVAKALNSFGIAAPIIKDRPALVAAIPEAAATESAEEVVARRAVEKLRRDAETLESQASDAMDNQRNERAYSLQHRAVQLRQEIDAGPSSVPADRGRLVAALLVEIDMLTRLDRFAEAESVADRTAALAADRARDDAPEADAIQQYASALRLAGDSRFYAKRHLPALERYDEAIEFLTSRMALDNQRRILSSLLADVHLDRAIVQARLKNPAESDSSAEAAKRLYRELSAVLPSRSHTFRKGEATACSLQGDVFEQHGDLASARDRFAEAVAAQHKAIKVYPNCTPCLQTLYTRIKDLLLVRVKLQEWDAARLEVQDAMEWMEYRTYYLGMEASVALASGRADWHEDVVTRIWTEAGGGSAGADSKSAVRTCSMKPYPFHAVPDWRRLVDGLPAETTESAAGLFRAGEANQAVERYGVIAASQPLRGVDLCFLAMAQHAAGDAEAAKRTLQSADEWMQAAAGADSGSAAATSRYQNDFERTETEALRAEAKERIEAAPAS